MKKLLGLILSLAPLIGFAQSPFEVNMTLPTTSPYYTVATTTNVKVSTGMGGLTSTTSSAASSTNTAWWSTLMCVYGPYTTYDFQFSLATVTNSVTTIYLFLYRVPDGVNYNTNTPIWTSGAISVTGGSNLFNTNFTALVLGDAGYYQLGVGNAGTNTVTAYAQLFRHRTTVVQESP